MMMKRLHTNTRAALQRVGWMNHRTEARRARFATGRGVAVLLLLTFAASGVRADNWADAANRDTRWTYSFANGSTNTIATAGQLAQFAYLVNQSNSFIGTVNIITADIDLSAHEWTPAGILNRLFAGTLTVATPGRVITGLTVTNATGGNFGLFTGIALEGRVDSLTLSNVYINAKSSTIGAIAGENQGVITNCAVYGTISGDGRIGGITGENRGTLSHCTTYGSGETGNPLGDIRGALAEVGGIAGRNDSGSIEGCINRASISGAGYVGGITGKGENSGGLAGCENYGSITGTGSYIGGIAGHSTSNRVEGCINHGSISGSSYVGGISGSHSYFILANCENNGDVTGTGEDIGGIAGWNSGTLVNTINRGAVSGPNEVGGIAGRTTSAIKNCVNLGAVSGTTAIGSLAGRNSGTIQYSYFKTGTVTGDGAIGTGSAVTDCATFGDAPGTLSTSIFGADTLSGALNAFVTANPVVDGIALTTWSLLGSPDGYPAITMDPNSWAHEANRDLSWSYSTTAGATNTIATAGQLAQFAYLVNQSNSFIGTVNIITADIDLSAHEWTPAGILNRLFAGTLTVATPGRVITGLTVTNATGGNFGLFTGIALEGRVDSLTLSNVYINAKSSTIGAIAGENQGVITNCAVYGTISGDGRIGGITGENRGTLSHCTTYGSGETGNPLGDIRGALAEVGGIAGRNDSGSIESCINRASISGAGYVGGITGKGENSGGLAGCENYGSITGTRSYIGGIAGHSTSNRVESCINHGSISGTNNAGGITGSSTSGNIGYSTNYAAISGFENCGGIAGGTEGSGTIKNCWNSGKITGNSSVAGIVGANNVVGIENCFNSGKISGRFPLGGIAGTSLRGSIINCENTGNIEGSFLGPIGGIVGKSDRTPLFNCVNRGGITSLFGNNNIGGIAGHATNVINNCVNLGTISVVTETETGGIVGLNEAAVQYSYFKTGIVNGDGIVCENGANGTVANCSTFGVVPGALSEAVFGTTSLLAALNAYVDANPTTNGVTLSRWVLEGSLDGYPSLGIFSGNWTNEPNRDTSWSYSPTAGATNLIATPHQFAQFAYLVNQGHTFSGTVNIITADLNLSAHPWTPVGSRYNPFVGTLTSATPGLVISGLTIYKPETTSVGLFGNIAANGRVGSLTLTDVNITGSSGIGAIAGNSSGTITDCVVHGTILGQTQVGGIVGTNNAGRIAYCTNNAVISSGTDIGGIAGINANAGIINSCENIAKITAPGTRMGGIAGKNDSGRIENCINRAMISGANKVGGIAGMNTNAGIITQCENFNDITGATSSAGGIAGENGGTILNCFNRNEVSCTNNVGGIAGVNAGVIHNVLNRGLISGTANLGGIAGENAGTIQNCVNSGRISGSENCGGMAGLNSGAIQYIYIAGGTISGNIFVGKSTGEGSIADWRIFSGNETITKPIFGTTSLTKALNAYIAENPAINGVDLLPWTLHGSPDVYPILMDQWVNIPNRDVSWHYATSAGVTNFIATAGQLAQFAYLVDQGHTFADTVNLITNDLDLSAYIWTSAGYPDNTAFRGTLMATPGTVINGLTLSTGADAGFFHRLATQGCVDSLTLTNVNISGGSGIGAVAGHNQGSITHCVVYGAIRGEYYVGGIVGSNNTGRIENCTNHAGITATNYAGGIAGLNTSGQINNGINRGTISGAGYLGGIAGESSAQSVISHCENFANMTSAASGVGGIVGINNKSRIENGINRGTLSGNSCLGGIAGQCQNNSTIAHCTNIANVTGTGNSIGGIAGQCDNSLVNNGINTGRISATNYAGGIAGESRNEDSANVNPGSIINCENRGAIHATDYVGGITGWQNTEITVNCINRGAMNQNQNHAGGIVGNLYGGSIINAMNLGTITGQDGYVGGMAGYCRGEAIQYGYFKSGTVRSNLVVSYGSTRTTNCPTFGDAPGTLAEETHGTTSLLGALNAYVATNLTTRGVELLRWTLRNSPDGYPVFCAPGYTTQGVPYEWLDEYALATGGTSSDYEAAAADTSRKNYPVWHDYVTGVNPTNLDARFTVYFTNNLDIAWSPDMSASGRTYKVYGTSNLFLPPTDWMSPPATNAATPLQYFHIQVELD